MFNHKGEANMAVATKLDKYTIHYLKYTIPVPYSAFLFVGRGGGGVIKNDSFFRKDYTNMQKFCKDLISA